jgi:hypothetical protein
MDEEWPEQQMSAHVYPRNTHLICDPAEGSDGVEFGLNKDPSFRNLAQEASLVDSTGFS